MSKNLILAPLFIILAGCATQYGCSSNCSSAKPFGADTETAMTQTTMVNMKGVSGYPNHTLRLVEEFSMNCPPVMNAKEGCYQSTVYHYDYKTLDYTDKTMPAGFTGSRGALRELTNTCGSDTYSGFIYKVVDTQGNLSSTENGRVVPLNGATGPLLSALCAE